MTTSDTRTGPVPIAPSWLDAFPREHRHALRQFGMPPDAHPRAAEYNQRVLDAARRGLSGDALAETAARLHVETFGASPAGAADAEYFRDLIAINRAGEVDHLGYVVIERDGAMSFGGKGTYDPAYVMRALEAVADVLDGTLDRSEFTRRLGATPPRTRVSESSGRRFRADIDSTVRDLARRLDRGEIAGAVVVACGPGGAAARTIGTVPPRPTARLLRKFCDEIERASGTTRQVPDRLPAEWFKEER
jgi:hypothetical protein